MKHTTTGLTETMLETLDVETFIKGVQQFDMVTQRQCLLKARKELWKPRVIGLHGTERTKTAMDALRAALGPDAN